MKRVTALYNIKILCFTILALSLSNCTNSDSTSYTITIGAYTQDALGNYNFTGNELIFDSNEECQTWQRTASGDSHSASSHSHFNAAKNVSFNNSTSSFSWTEFGPELDLSSIESTCVNGINGVNKTVNNSSYYQDKPNLFLKVTNVVKN